jgi:MYXO-CTERM domain-containing protein
VTPSGPLANKGFYEFQFFDWNAYNYSGLFSAMAINYGTSGLTNAQVIAQVNYQSGLTGLTATTAAIAGDAHCRFVDFLPTDLDNSIVLNWFPAIMPTTPGLSQVFTFAWDLTVISPPSFVDNGLSVGAVGSLPSPGAMALMGLAGVFGGRRRRA